MHISEVTDAQLFNEIDKCNWLKSYFLNLHTRNNGGLMKLRLMLKLRDVMSQWKT